METTKVLFSSPVYPEIKCDPNSEWGVYYNTDTQSEDFETGDSLPGLKTTVIVENIDKQSADIIANALNIHSETGLSPSQLLDIKNAQDKYIEHLEKITEKLETDVQARKELRNNLLKLTDNGNNSK